MNILVCGGAGYVGSHLIKMLADAGHQVTVFDNLSTGHRWAVRWGRFVEGDLLHPSSIDWLFATKQFDAVMHLAGRSLVQESFEKPNRYYRNNVIGTCNLLAAMRNAEVKKIIFTSTAEIFGECGGEKIKESHSKLPLSPYGRTKHIVEQMLEDHARAYGVRSVSLRCFNIAGADSCGEIGEVHDPESHLIPNVLKAAISGHPLKIYGKDYDTPDGTCIRDYIHVNDICRAHLQALDYIEENQGDHGFNLGAGKGYSVLEVIKAAEKVIGREVPYEFAKRRPGDPPVLIADTRKAKRTLLWKPEFKTLEKIIETSWDWEQGRAKN